MVILRKRVGALSQSALARFVKRASRAARLSGHVNVLVTGSQELRDLNRRFRGKNRPTDVLSFLPAPGLAPDFAGDLAISGDIAARNARRFGHSTAQEVKVLALHGILHLAGYDHELDQGQMALREQRLRRLLGLPASLIERHSLAPALRSGRRARAGPSKPRSRAGRGSSAAASQ